MSIIVGLCLLGTFLFHHLTEEVDEGRKGKKRRGEEAMGGERKMMANLIL